jgi:hypothetical protein
VDLQPQQPEVETPPPESGPAGAPLPAQPDVPATEGAPPQQPAVPGTEARPARTKLAPPGLLVDEPATSPKKEKPAVPATGRSIINWTKFWDSLVVGVSYPWLCCGIVLLLGVPLGLLFLEIKGRRRPRRLPETPVRRSGPPGPGRGA